jgi:hypothetical protein
MTHAIGNCLLFSPSQVSRPPQHLLEQLVLSVAHKHVQLAVHSCLVNCGFEILRHAFQACHSNRNMHQQLEDSH